MCNQFYAWLQNTKTLIISFEGNSALFENFKATKENRMHSSMMRTDRGSSHLLGGGGGGRRVGVWSGWRRGGCLVCRQGTHRMELRKETPRRSSEMRPPWQTEASENITFPILRMQLVKRKNYNSMPTAHLPNVHVCLIMKKFESVLMDLRDCWDPCMRGRGLGSLYSQVQWVVVTRYFPWTDKQKSVPENLTFM